LTKGTFDGFVFHIYANSFSNVQIWVQNCRGIVAVKIEIYEEILFRQKKASG